jgi:hypothetical protein
MRRLSVVVGALGLAGVLVLPATAQQKQMQLFGKTYNVECVSRDQTFKTADGRQVKIVLQPTMNSAGDEVNYGRRAALSFAEGADPSKDRLFIAAQTGANDETPPWHGLYMLTGADANGNFTPTSATLTEFFGGPGNYLKNGRIVALMLINDENTGEKKDRNFLALGWTGDNGYRLYDLDSMNNNYADDALFYDIIRDVGGPTEDRYLNVVEDPNSPYGSYAGYAPLPTDDKHTIVVIGTAQNGGVEASIWDTKTDKFFPVLTDLSEQTASASIPLPTDLTPHALIHYAADEYWLLASSPAPGGNDISLDTNNLYRVKLTLPADPSKAKPGDIKAEVLGKENLLGTPLQSGPGGVFGMAVGREVAPGLRRLYFGTNEGMLCVATPVP